MISRKDISKRRNRMKYRYHMIVIGAGSAGLVTANGAARFGCRVALIEEDKMGGDCLNTGCVPSKTFLKSAHLAKSIRQAHEVGIESTMEEIDLKKIKDRVYKVINEIAPHDSSERYGSLGVDVYKGRCVFIDRHTVAVNGEELTGRIIVIATGSDPVIPDIKGLEQINYLTNKNVFDLEKLPSHLIVLGGGPVGLELGQGFRHLGSAVTIIDKNKSLFKKDDCEVAQLMEKVLVDDGIDLCLGAEIVEVNKEKDEITVTIRQGDVKRKVSGNNILVSLGRAPATKDLGLEKAGVLTDVKGYVIADRSLRTNIKNIYACGDVAGPYQFTHMAGYQASMVVRNAVFGLRAKTDYSYVPWTTYTKPEVAHVGYTEKSAVENGIYKKSIIVEISENDRAKTENDTKGFLKLNLGKKGRIIGATLVGEKAGEMIPLVSMALRMKMTPLGFYKIIFSYPTESEIFADAAGKYLEGIYKPWHKKLISSLFCR
jgi:pyruvate/2-oxoglutarate dehydrogenase complex dihydrolipoamide dehydrogenase (E3) component